jgi:hypothetical protein
MTETTSKDSTATKTAPKDAPAKTDHADAKPEAKPLQETPGPAALQSQRDIARQPADAKTAAQLPELQLTKPVVLAGQEKQIANLIQNNMLLQFAADYTGGSGGDAKKQDELVQTRLKNLQSEQQKNVWGPESQAAFKDYINWVQQLAIPRTVRDLDSNGVAMPPGYPGKIPTDSSGKVISDADYARQLSSGGGQIDLKIATPDAPKVPDLADLEKLSAVSDWTNRARTDITTKESADLLALDKQKIGSELPASWAIQPGQSPEQYQSALRVGSNLYEQLSTAAIAVHALNQMGDSKLELPPGITVNDDGHGHITPSIDLPAKLRDLQNDPKIKQYLEWYEKTNPTITQEASTLKLAAKNPYTNLLYGDVTLRPSTDINGNRISNQAVLDANGRLVSIIDPTKEKAPVPPPGADGKPAAAYKTVDVDEIQQRFTARAVNPNDKNSDVVVDISVQAQQSVPIGYDLLNKNIGEPLQVQTRTYKADDMVMYNGKLVQARTLPERLTENQALYVGGKAFNIALDASMFVGGASALAKVAIEGSVKAVAEIATKEAAATITEGAERTVVARSAAEALAGIGGLVGNNTWGQEYAPWINTARAVYFGGTGIAGMSSGLQSIMSGGDAVQQAMKVAGPAWLQTMSNVSEKTMSGLMPIMYGQIAVGVSSRYYDLLKTAVQGSGSDTDPLAVSLFAASQLPEHTILGANAKDNPAGSSDGTSLASIAQDYKSQIKSDAPGAKDAQDILDKAGNFAKLSDSEKAAAIKQWTENLTFTADDIKELDKANNGKLNDQEIQDLMDPQKRAAMKDKVRQTAEQIWANRNSDKFPEVDKLRALEATPMLDSQTASQLQDQIDQLQQQQKVMNANIQTASRMALLMTATSSDGKLPATLGSTTETVGTHLATEWVYGLGLQLPEPTIIGNRSVTENISSQAVLNGLRSDLYSSGTMTGENSGGPSRTTAGANGETTLKNGSDQLGGANLAVADLLSRTGALAPQQYASIIEDKLANGTADEKARLLSTTEGPVTASVLDSLYQSQIRMQDPTLSGDEKSVAQAMNFGDGYSDLMNSLAKAASNDPDEKVRAMAAATYEGAKRLANNLDQNIAASQVLAAYQTIKSQSTNSANGANGATGEAQNPTDTDTKITQQQSIVAAAQADRKKIIDRMQSELEGAKSDPTSGMASIKNDLIADLQTPLPDDSAASAIQTRVDAGTTLALINGNGADGEANRQLINSSISEAFNKSDRAQSLHIMDTLPRELLKQLSSDSSFSAHLIDLLPTAKQAAYKAYTPDTVALLGKISQFAKDASPEFKSELQGKLNDLLSARSPISMALPPTQAAAAKAASSLNAQGTLDSLEKLAADVSGSSPISREAAVQALSDMQDPKLKSLLPDLLSKETDQQIHTQLLALNEKLATGSSASEADRATGMDAAKRFVDVATISQRYPTIKNFDDAAQLKFLKDNNLDLLNHDTFEYQAKVAARQNVGAMVAYGLQQELPKLVNQREAEFTNLIKLSQGDSSDSTTQMARLYLERIAGSQGKPVGANDSTFQIPMELGLGGTITANYNEQTGQIGSMVVDNPRTPDITKETTHIPINKPRTQSWQDEAATVLAKQAATRENGVDLDGYMIGNLLSNPTGLSDASVNSLADSWRTMYAPDASGRRIISPDRYKYAITMALQTEQLRRQAMGTTITSVQKTSLDALDAKLQGMLSNLG